MKLSSQQLLTLTGGIVAILSAVGLSAYIWLTMLTVVSTPSKQQFFPLAGAQNLLNAANLIKRAALLTAVPASEPAAIKYGKGDLGKSDLTKLE